MVRLVVPISVNVPLSSSTHNKSEQPEPQENRHTVMQIYVAKIVIINYHNFLKRPF